MTHRHAPTLAALALLTAAISTACGGGGGSTGSTSSTTSPPVTQSAPTQVAVANVNERTVGSNKMSSSTQLSVSWTAPSGVVDHYEIAVTDGATGTSTTVTSTTTSKALAALKAATSYSVKVTACGDASCSKAGAATAVTGTTSAEYWQLQGSGNSVTELSKIASDGGARISATRFGPEAGPNADRLQLYYGQQANNLPALGTAFTSQRTDASVPDSYLSFISMAGTTGLISPPSTSTLVKQVATGQGVPLSAAMGGKVRLFFEAQGADGKTRIMYLDSQDGYLGRDFNAGASSVCASTADYQSGGCVPTVAIGLEGDATLANPNLRNARQFKLGYPTLTDWRWNGDVGTFMVFTAETITACTTFGSNHGYAVWTGVKWDVQYQSDGCPKLFKGAQAAFPMHLGGVRYKLYYGDTSVTTGRVSGSNLPFLGPKKLIYADGANTGSATTVDFEDWESTSLARNVIFLWPNGDQLDDTAEGYIDDFHFLAPTGSLSLQVMYFASTNGTQLPIGVSAVLLNP
jgi:hypothetical protein